MPRPDIDTIIAELTPKHKTRKRVLISVAFVAFIVGIILSYQFIIKEEIDPDLLVSDAKLLMAQDKFDEAIQNLKLAYEHDSEDSQICNLLAMCFDRIGEVSEAIDWQRRAVQIEPENTNLRMKFALLLEKDGQIKKAIKEWEKIAELKPNATKNCVFCLRINSKAKKAKVGSKPTGTGF